MRKMELEAGHVRTQLRCIPPAKKTLVLERDDYTCQMCGAASGMPHHEIPWTRANIRVGRIVPVRSGGGDDVGNLRAVCSVCDEGVRGLTLDRPSFPELLVQLRRATGFDQLEVLSWLINKYPVRAREISSKPEK